MPKNNWQTRPKHYDLSTRNSSLIMKWSQVTSHCDSIQCLPKSAIPVTSVVGKKTLDMMALLWCWWFAFFHPLKWNIKRKVYLYKQSPRRRLVGWSWYLGVVQSPRIPKKIYTVVYQLQIDLMWLFRNQYLFEIDMFCHQEYFGEGFYKQMVFLRGRLKTSLPAIKCNHIQWRPATADKFSKKVVI